MSCFKSDVHITRILFYLCHLKSLIIQPSFRYTLMYLKKKTTYFSKIQFEIQLMYENTVL